MPVFSVDSDQLIAQSGAVRATADRVHTDVQAMHAQLLALQQTWQGGASVGFQGVLDRWRAAQLQIEQALGEIGQALNIAGTQYADSELSAAGMFRG